MVDPVAPLQSSFVLPQQSVSSVNLEQLFTQQLEQSTQPMGDAMVEGIQTIRNDLDVQADQIQSRLNDNPEMSLHDLIQVQMDLSRLVLVEETLARSVSKSSQNIDTLLKSQ
ncbi:EscI/YscI/HrpB family type III secretion system inner rod protein [Photobacterium proteolyticum]|jgi:type III secretion protein I|uniref:EscI/YscI/HrpB family type III secretion system inner rod protein n=2 Tax=Photobacterium TaxID=657 RepID=A0A1Q9H1R6_9GAMM|nr:MULTISPECIES: type III secretion system inner rod subunit SctI [Photobacterium]NBI51825.1 EscI/YscI/HrpB family type III secretion system inner rod protein [Photobacterium alginatilyticum]OLQ81615.1 EscI/YscI/HrpB family type III secretion system inner rod protein [Photobacterium proteolyticum]